MSTTTVNGIEFLRINNDTNGNPRYVCNHKIFITKSDERHINSFKNSGHSSMTLYIGGKEKKGIVNAWLYGYELALRRAKEIGGKRFNSKTYNGGIVIKSTNLEDTVKHIKKVLN